MSAPFVPGKISAGRVDGGIVWEEGRAASVGRGKEDQRERETG